MKYCLNYASIKNTTKCLLISLIFSCMFSSLHATANNFIEKSLALATIPFDIAACYYDVEQDKKPAALLHLTSDTLSILNKAFFFYNNVQVQGGSSSWRCGRDGLVNGLITIRDVTKWIQHLKECLNDPNNDVPVDDVSVEQEESPETSSDQAIDINAQAKVDEISSLAYGWQVVVLPCLKGLSAFALACAQDESMNFAGQHARFVTTAAHSLVRLLEEYAALKSNSRHKKLLAALLFINTLWLIKEVIDYRAHAKASDIHQFQGQPGDCPICFDHSDDCVQLPCGHACCRDCLTQHINIAIRGRAALRLHCPQPGCNHIIDEADVAGVTKGDRVIREAYSEATFQESLAGGQFPGMRHCPTPNCDHVFINDQDAREQHDCPACHQRYCANCLGRHPLGAFCRAQEIPVAGDVADRRSAEWIAGHTVECPRCHNHIERNGGCNHMTCRCGHNFCYECRQPAFAPHYHGHPDPMPLPHPAPFYPAAPMPHFYPHPRPAPYSSYFEDSSIFD